MDAIFRGGDFGHDPRYGVLLGLLLQDIGTCYVDRSAPFDQLANDLEADAAVAAGHDGDFAGEVLGRGYHFERWEQTGKRHCGRCY